MPALGLGKILRIVQGPARPGEARRGNGKVEARYSQGAEVEKRRHERHVREVAHDFLDFASGGNIEGLLADMGYTKTKDREAEKSRQVVANVAEMFGGIPRGKVKERRTLLSLVACEYTIAELKSLGFKVAEKGVAKARIHRRSAKANDHPVEWVESRHVEKTGPKGLSEEQQNKAVAVWRRFAQVNPKQEEGTSGLTMPKRFVVAQVCREAGVSEKRARLLQPGDVRETKQCTFMCSHCTEYGVARETSDRVFGNIAALDALPGPWPDDRLERQEVILTALEQRADAMGASFDLVEEHALAKAAAQNEADSEIHVLWFEEQNEAYAEDYRAPFVEGSRVGSATFDYMSDPRCGGKQLNTVTDMHEKRQVAFLCAGVALPIVEGAGPEEEQRKVIRIGVVSGNCAKFAFNAVKAVDRVLKEVKERYPLRWAAVESLRLWYDCGTHYRAYVFVGSILTGPLTHEPQILEVLLRFAERHHGKTAIVDGWFQKCARWLQQANLDKEGVDSPEKLATWLEGRHAQAKEAAAILKPKPKREPKRPVVRRWEPNAPFHVVTEETGGLRVGGGTYTELRSTAVELMGTLSLCYKRDAPGGEFRLYDQVLAGPGRALRPVADPWAAVIRPKDKEGGEHKWVVRRRHPKVGTDRKLREKVTESARGVTTEASHSTG